MHRSCVVPGASRRVSLPLTLLQIESLLGLLSDPELQPLPNKLDSVRGKAIQQLHEIRMGATSEKVYRSALSLLQTYNPREES